MSYEFNNLHKHNNFWCLGTAPKLFTFLKLFPHLQSILQISESLTNFCKHKSWKVVTKWVLTQQITWKKTNSTHQCNNGLNKHPTNSLKFNMDLVKYKLWLNYQIRSMSWTGKQKKCDKYVIKTSPFSSLNLSTKLTTKHNAYRHMQLWMYHSDRWKLLFFSLSHSKIVRSNHKLSKVH